MIDRAKIEKELGVLPEGWITLLEANVENAIELNLVAVQYLVSKNYNGIIVSVSRPYMNLISLYKKNNINIDNLFFIDCVSKSESSIQKSEKNVSFIDNISDLTSILISIEEAIKVSGPKFIVFDSVNSMLIHNKPEVFARFVHSLLTKMRVRLISGFILSFEDETNKEVRAEIAQLCDKVIRV